MCIIEANEGLLKAPCPCGSGFAGHPAFTYQHVHASGGGRKVLGKGIWAIVR